MTTNLLTVLSSGFLGAISGAVVSWLIAPQLVGRQQRAEARINARKQIATIVGVTLTEVRQYRGRAYGSMGRGGEEKPVLHTDDILLAARILVESNNLGWWRRQAVKRRLERLFGKNTLALCEMHGEKATDAKSMVGFVLNRQYMATQHPEVGLPDRGQFDLALRCPPESAEVQKLERSLKRLAANR